MPRKTPHSFRRYIYIYIYLCISDITFLWHLADTRPLQNIAFDGGVIHVIDSVLTLPPAAAPALTKLDLKSLAESLTKANLVKTVEELKDVTIFAPADSAFAKLSSTSSTLSVEQLSAVLTYHVVNGTVAYSTDLKDGQKVKTVNGQEVTVRIKNGEVMVGNAKVVTPDVLISNGVVHVIDK